MNKTADLLEIANEAARFSPRTNMLSAFRLPGNWELSGSCCGKADWMPVSRAKGPVRREAGARNGPWPTRTSEES